MGRAGDRTPCVIDGCHRTTQKPYSEWICGKHWQRLTRAERRIWARLKRKSRRLAGSAKFDARVDRIWEGLKRRAIE